jgi:hypothetical protein
VWHPVDLAQPDRAAFRGAALDGTRAELDQLCAPGCVAEYQPA